MGCGFLLENTFQKQIMEIVDVFCEYSQFQHRTECSRQHISPTTSKTTKGWRFALMPPPRKSSGFCSYFYFFMFFIFLFFPSFIFHFFVL